jgi:hypothetical protein
VQLGSKKFKARLTHLQGAAMRVARFLVGLKMLLARPQPYNPVSRADDAKDTLMIFFGYDPYFLDGNAVAVVSSLPFDRLG